MEYVPSKYFVINERDRGFPYGKPCRIARFAFYVHFIFALAPSRTVTTHSHMEERDSPLTELLFPLP